MNFDKYKTIILDLDNTLYDERTFLVNSLRQFNKEHKNLISTNIDFLIREFLKFYKENGNHKIYDLFISNYVKKECLNIFLETLRKPSMFYEEIKLYDGVDLFIKSYSKNIIIITDGNIAQQNLKYNYLGLNKLIKNDRIIFSDYFGGKNTSKFLLYAKKRLKLEKEGIVVGDNELSDGVLANNLGFDFLKVNEKNNLFRKYM